MTNFASIYLAFALAGLCMGRAHAETVYLKTGEVFSGKIEHYYGGIVSVLLPSGEKRVVGINELAQIEFAPRAPGQKPIPKRTSSKPLPKSLDKATTPVEAPTLLPGLKKPSGPFSTPMATFQTWREAALKGETDKIVECYASFRQKGVKKKLRKLSGDEKAEQRAAAGQTHFTPGEPYYQGDRAMLEVHWTKGLAGDSQVLQFILEKNQWKIVE